MMAYEQMVEMFPEAEMVGGDLILRDRKSVV